MFGISYIASNKLALDNESNKNQAKNNKVVVILSAMAGVTNHLQSLINEVNFSKTNDVLPSKESDLVMTSG